VKPEVVSKNGLWIRNPHGRLYKPTEFGAEIRNFGFWREKRKVGIILVNTYFMLKNGFLCLLYSIRKAYLE
jgi:hypothetical protein